VAPLAPAIVEHVVDDPSPPSFVAVDAVASTDATAPARLIGTRPLEVALAVSQIALAAVSAVAALETFGLWRRLRDDAGMVLTATDTARLNDIAALMVSLACGAGIVVIGWTVITAINGRRITLFSPHWLPIVLGWSIGPALIAWGATSHGDRRDTLFAAGVGVTAIVTVVVVAFLRRVAGVVIGNAAPLNQWLIVLVLGGVSSSFATGRADAAPDRASTAVNITAALALDAALHLALAFFSFRAARHVRLGFAGKPRTLRAGRRIVADAQGLPLLPMEQARRVTMMLLVATSVLGATIVTFAARAEGVTITGDQLHAIKAFVAAIGGLFLLAVGWWTVAVGRNAAMVSGEARPVLFVGSCLVCWIGVPVAIAVVAGGSSGWVTAAAVAVAAVAAMIGHARVAGLARCTDMRYVAWGLFVARMTYVVGATLRWKIDDDAVGWGRVSDTYLAGNLVAGLIVLLLAIRVSRSLTRIETAVRTRKDQLTPDVLVSDAAAAFFSGRP